MKMGGYVSFYLPSFFLFNGGHCVNQMEEQNQNFRSKRLVLLLIKFLRLKLLSIKFLNSNDVVKLFLIKFVSI